MVLSENATKAEKVLAGLLGEHIDGFSISMVEQQWTLHTGRDDTFEVLVMCHNWNDFIDECANYSDYVEGE